MAFLWRCSSARHQPREAQRRQQQRQQLCHCQEGLVRPSTPPRGRTRSRSTGRGLAAKHSTAAWTSAVVCARLHPAITKLGGRSYTAVAL
jgi:hypothetical protein